MHVLIIETGKHKGKRLKLPDGDAVIGRDPQAQVRIASNEVSRQHCLLMVRGQRLLVRDLGSSNGTFVNGEPIQADRELQPGDLLVVGPMGFRCHGPAPAEPSAALPAVSPKKPTDDKDGLSDDEIALLLADGPAEGIADGDTAVISYGDAGPRPGQQEPIKPVKKKVWRSTAEEAADIIARHKAMMSGKNRDAGK